MTAVFPTISFEYEPTRATLHAYSKAIGAVARAHGIAHPKWWHLSLNVRPDGLVSDPLPVPTGDVIGIVMDIVRGRVVVRSTGGGEDSFDLAAGMTGTDMGEALIAAVGRLGLEGPVDRSRFEDNAPREFDPAAATAYLRAFTAAATVLERHRLTLGDRVGPVQVWPHGFDIAFEWFGTATTITDGKEAPAQLNLGLFPGGDPYFYSSPWPFDENLLDVALPAGARWNTEGWQGAMLPYAEVAGAADGFERVAAFARAVHAAAAPTLEA
jgi:hypothetical protein